MITIYNPTTGQLIGTVLDHSLCNAIVTMIIDQDIDDINLDYDQDNDYNPTMQDFLTAHIVSGR